VSFTPHVPINDRDNPSICVLIESDLVGRTAPLSNSERNTGGLFGHGCGEPGRLTTFGCFYKNWISTLGHNRHAAPHRPSWRVQGQLFAMQESWPEISSGHNLYRWHSNKRQAPGECPSKRIEPPLVAAGAMRVVVPHSMHGGGSGWNGGGMTNGSLIFKRERVRALSHRRLLQSRSR
jgi:hypothetical protein